MEENGGVYAVLWSHSEGKFQIQPLVEATARGAKACLAGERLDYVLVALAGTRSEANQLREELERGKGSEAGSGQRPSRPPRRGRQQEGRPRMREQPEKREQQQAVPDRDPAP